MASKVTKQLSIARIAEVICGYDKGLNQKDIMEKYGISVISTQNQSEHFNSIITTCFLVVLKYLLNSIKSYFSKYACQNIPVKYTCQIKFVKSHLSNVQSGYAGNLDMRVPIPLPEATHLSRFVCNIKYFTNMTL